MGLRCAMGAQNGVRHVALGNQMEQRCWAQVRHKWRHVRLWFGGRSEGVTAMLMPRS